MAATVDRGKEWIGAVQESSGGLRTWLRELNGHFIDYLIARKYSGPLTFPLDNAVKVLKLARQLKGDIAAVAAEEGAVNPLSLAMPDGEWTPSVDRTGPRDRRRPVRQRLMGFQDEGKSIGREADRGF